MKYLIKTLKSIKIFDFMSFYLPKYLSKSIRKKLFLSKLKKKQSYFEHYVQKLLGNL